MISTVSLSAKLLYSFLKSLKVYIINSVFFYRFAQKKIHEIFAIFMRNINKILQIKSTVDFVTLLSFKYHNFLNVFFHELVNTLFERRFYDHKISLQKDKTFIFNSLYNMFQNELQILKKYLKKNLAKNFIQISSFSAVSSMLFIRKLNENLQFCVNY